MSERCPLSRRSVIGLLFATTIVGSGQKLSAQAAPSIKVYKESTCGCCTIWARHLTTAGFNVSTIDVPNIDEVKAKYGVPYRLASCHTAEVGGYVIEGHVPATVIKRLLAEAPSAKGLAVPGMPAGSPGMEGGLPEIYDVFLFGPNGQRSYARCRGAMEI